jgi:pimeloyl-ACP methyl ester carboxylesterase
MPELVSRGRRHLLGSAVAAMAIFLPRKAKAEAPLGVVRHVDAGLVRVGYFELGPTSGQAVVLLHGFPYDVHSYVEVAPLLAAAGYRVIVPHLRGHGSTRFLSARTFRNAQQSAVALDVVALMDALRIERPILAGFDWGARTANVIAALWPHRCKAMVAVNGYLITDLARNKRPQPPRVEWGWWYQYYFATERGRAGLEANRRELARLIWRFNSPNWVFDEAAFERTARSFDNPDYVPIVVHNYRWRLGLSPGEPRYQVLERRLAERPAITVPTITIDGDSDGVVPTSNSAAQAALFSGRRSHRIIPGAGHNLPFEAPRAFCEAILDVDSY